MKLHIQNLGIIKDVELELNKKLTLFCGPNSTGKTYLSYILNAIGNNFPDAFFDSELKSLQEEGLNLAHKAPFTIKKEYLDEFYQEVFRCLNSRKEEIFGISETTAKKQFKSLKIELEHNDNDIDIFCEKLSHSSNIKKTDQKYKFILENPYYIGLPEMEWSYLLRRFSGLNFTMLPVERNGIFTFKTELSLNRTELVNKMLATPIKANQLLNEKTRRYPMAITDCLMNACDLENWKKRKGYFYNLAVEIENKLLKGDVNITDNGEVVYSPQDNINLPFSMSSSIVKTLSSLVIYLKHQSQLGQGLIIDEPEMNLHPDNQVMLAQIFAKITNNNLPMIASTHSDYIIREINNLIVAKSLKNKGDNSYKQFYEDDSLLDFHDIQVIYFDFDKKGKVIGRTVDVDEYGFSIESIDQTAREQNRRSSILFNTLGDMEKED